MGIKILAIGDFHGKFQKSWENLIKREGIDLVLSNGDYCPFGLRKEFFKYVYASDDDKELWDHIGKKKYQEVELKDLKAAEGVLKKLGKLDVPAFSVSGNNDKTSWPDAMDENLRMNKKWNWVVQDRFTPMYKKYGIKDVNYSFAKFGDYIIIGGGPSSFPGKVKSKNYKKLRSKLDKLFKKFSKENKEGRVIFLTHNVPYDTKLDLIGKNAHKKAAGKHYGSKLVRRIVDKYRPLLHIAGHIHEAQGKQKLGKTVCVNTGGAHDGEAAIVEISYKGKVKVRFIN